MIIPILKDSHLQQISRFIALMKIETFLIGVESKYSEWTEESKKYKR